MAQLEQELVEPESPDHAQVTTQTRSNGFQTPVVKRQLMTSVEINTATPDLKGLSLHSNDLRVRAKVQIQQHIDYAKSKNRANTMLRRFDKQKKENALLINEKLNTNKLDGFRRLQNANGDSWYLPTDDPQYLTFYQAPGRKIADT